MKYKGILAKRRVYSPPPGLLASKKSREAWHTKESEEEIKRILELFRVHGVEPSDWVGLAMALAREHVPGMQVEKAKRGPVPVWDYMSRVTLRFDVDQYAQDHQTSISNACRILAMRDPYKSKLRGVGKSGQALRRQYNLADPRWIKVFEDARLYDKLDSAQKEEALKLTPRAKHAARGQNRE